MENRLAENIRKYRKELGLNQEDLAERLGITLGTVSKWERGISEPDLQYIMDLAELFHVSVDVMIGFTMRGNNADKEAERISTLENEAPLEETAAEYDRALMKFPNHFDIVYGAAKCYMQIGVVYKREPELRRAIELLRHAIDLFSQNKDPELNELDLSNDIAQCYATLKEYRRAIEEYKKNNVCGINDAEIGLLLTENEKNPKEGIKYIQRAFLNQIGTTITSMSGFVIYYRDTGNTERVIQSVEWTLEYLKSLKEDPKEKCYLDKMICLHYFLLAIGMDMTGRDQKAEDSLVNAVRMAKAFDEHPVYTLDNILFAEKARGSTVYDNAGPTAMESLVRTMEKDGQGTSEKFRERFYQLIKIACEKKGVCKQTLLKAED